MNAELVLAARVVLAALSLAYYCLVRRAGDD